MNGNTRNLLYVLSLTPALLVIYGNLHGGWFAWGNTIYILFILATLEWALKPFRSLAHTDKDDQLPQLILWLHVPAQLACVLTFFYGIAQQILFGYTALGAALSMGISTGSSAIVVAHEYIHRKSSLQQWYGKLLLFTAGNFYFFVEHLRVHHKWVGTDKDSATAKKNQSVYGFFLSSSMGQFLGALKLENERLIKANKSPYSLQNYVIRQLFLHAVLDTCIVYFIGWAALGWFVLHCVFANFLLEYVNYIEHYGLSRAEKQRVTEIHSWQSDAPISRFFLIDLSRHADHHYYASKPYHTLVSYEKSPELPSGYAGMFFIAAIPPLWYAVMNKRIPQ